MVKNLCEKLRANFPATTHGYSMVNIACLDDVFSELFNWKPSGRSTTTVKRKEKEKKRPKIILKNWKA